MDALPSLAQLQKPEASHFDVVIIGSGAGGGTLARVLAPTGLRILILERGDWLPQEPQNWDAEAVFQQGRYLSKDTWYDGAGKPFQPGSHYFVGGATKMYGAHHFRLRERDFEELAHRDGLSPAWPLRYSDFEPWYQRAEEMYHVHGLRGEDPTDPPSEAPYPHPPISHEQRIAMLADDLRAAGLRPFHAPSGVMLDEGNMPYSRCRRCNNCDGFPCLVHAKGDAEVCGVRPALAANANLFLLTRAEVRKLHTDPSGRSVSAVELVRDGEELRYSAHIVVVSCGAANSARLLLLSANDRHPRGLANGSDQVGRNLMKPQLTSILQLSAVPNSGRYARSLACHDFYWGDQNVSFPLGCIQNGGGVLQDPLFAESPPVLSLVTRLMPNFGLEQLASRSVSWWAMSAVRPDPHNRISLRGDRVQVSYQPNNREAHDRLVYRWIDVLKALEADPLTQVVTPAPTHPRGEAPLSVMGFACGTCRMGSNPATSVVDLEGRSHEIANLTIADASLLPGCPAVGPGLTVIANALRIADRLVRELR